MKSVWSDSARLARFEKLYGDRKTDVLIIGGGLAGLLCAYTLKNRGIDYLVIESDKIFRGVSINTTAKITSQHGFIYSKLTKRYGEQFARLYYKANEEALAEYRKLCQNIDCDFETKPSYVYTADGKKLIDELEAVQKIDADAKAVYDLPLPLDRAGAVRFENQAQFNPVKFISRLTHDLKVYEHTRALEYDGRSVVTDGGKITASKIIVATHFPFINKHGSYFLKMYQHRSYVLALDNAPDVEGMYVDEDSSGLSFRNYGGLLLLGGGSHRTGKQGGNWNELEAFARKHYPQAKIKYKFSTQDCMTLDSVPYIGNYSKNTPDMYVATGFNKWGMTSSMVAANLLADLVSGKQNRYRDIFSPSRSIMHPQLISNATHTVINLLTPTSPRCPHMGCALKRNIYEHSWDCPCHGSRFSDDGKLLDNPATSDLNIK